jgi:hypothetical protein
MNNEEKIKEEINKHARHWDCYNDCPLEYNHSNKLFKELKKFTVSFNSFLRENYSTQEEWENITLPDNFYRKFGGSEEFTIEQVLEDYLKQDNG